RTPADLAPEVAGDRLAMLAGAQSERISIV
ncbi:MAG: hypothetical protein QOD50_292, partial [Actinomycetota bacterium]|nr:hypothetical protein [Actinomycetota bacterium]